MSNDAIPNGMDEITPEWLIKALRKVGLIGDTTVVCSLTKTHIGENEGFTGGALRRCQLTYPPLKK